MQFDGDKAPAGNLQMSVNTEFRTSLLSPYSRTTLKMEANRSSAVMVAT
jgi:hypothetical protein